MVPARRAPKRKSSPTVTAQAPSWSASTVSMKADRRQPGKRGIEARHREAVDAERGEEPRPRRRRRQAEDRLVGPEEAARIGLEGQHHRRARRAGRRRRWCGRAGPGGRDAPRRNCRSRPRRPAAPAAAHRAGCAARITGGRWLASGMSGDAWSRAAGSGDPAHSPAPVKAGRSPAYHARWGM